MRNYNDQLENKKSERLSRKGSVITIEIQIMVYDVLRCTPTHSGQSVW